MTRRLLAPYLFFLLVAGPAVAQTGERVVQVKGSDTIGGSLGPALAEGFEADNPQVDVRWDSLGSGTAFVGLFDRSADLGASSRSIRPGELEEAGRLGIRLQELVLGYDGIAVLVHPSNPVAELTMSELTGIFTGRIDRWSELGGPDQPIRRVSRPSYSGTHGFFRDHVLGEEAFADDTDFVEHSEEIAQLVASDRDAVSYLGMGWVGPGVKPVAIVPEPGAPAVLPSLDTVRRGTYPIYRPLLLYTRGMPEGDTRELVAFILGPTGRQLVKREGFIPPDTASLPGWLARPSQLSPSQRAVRPGDATADLLRVVFRLGGSTLDTDARRTLDRLARRLSGSGERLLVTGHADSEGDAEVNRRVSLRRARAVADYLAARGIERSRVTVEGHGEDRPVATNDTAVGRSLNRRVDVVVLPPG